MNKKFKILYAEDEVAASEVLVNIFNQFDFIDKVDVAHNGHDALELFNKNSDYDIVITDLKMPKKNGLELLQDIFKEKKPYTIITTAFEETEYLKEAIQLGVNKFFTKPLDVLQLVENIQEYYESVIKDLEYEHQKSMLEINSRLITLGEMIDSVIHQWTQPLSVISIENSGNEYVLRALGVTEQGVYESIENIDKNLKYLSETLDEFRSFARPDREKEDFLASKAVSKAMKILSYPIKMASLKIDVNVEEDFNILGYENQFAHILINLINNSRDAYKDNAIEDRVINITINKNGIIFKDFAGGVPDEIIDTIFDANVTSKDYGTGIGLYMSQKIAKNNDCLISVSKEGNSSIFEIKRIEV